uniref:Tuberoinfundibular peptide of 39 residues n=1 Tax=Tetraodon nigroviridis TaxID=99883 RepID=H3BZ83_TETNG
MYKLAVFHYSSLLLLCILDMTLMTSGLPPLSRRSFVIPVSNSPDDAADAKQDDWDVFFPSLFLHDWKIQMSAPIPEAAASSKRGHPRRGWLFAPQRTETRRFSEWLFLLYFSSLEEVLPAQWASQSDGTVKRNIVVADDAAFRQKSKLLTSMERQKWLNSYMQKLLVVNS